MVECEIYRMDDPEKVVMSGTVKESKWAIMDFYFKHEKECIFPLQEAMELRTIVTPDGVFGVRSRKL